MLVFCRLLLTYSFSLLMMLTGGNLNSMLLICTGTSRIRSWPLGSLREAILFLEVKNACFYETGTQRSVLASWIF